MDNLADELRALAENRPHEMVSAPGYASGQMCRNCAGLGSEIAYVLGPICPDAKAVIVPLDLIDRILAALAAPDQSAQIKLLREALEKIRDYRGLYRIGASIMQDIAAKALAATKGDVG